MSTPKDSPPSQHRTWLSTGWVLAAVFVATVVVAATVVLLTGHHHDNGSSPRRQATASVPPSTTPTSPTGDGFATPSTDIYGRRVDIPVNAAGQPLPQTVAPLAANDPNWLTAAPAGTTGRGGWQRVHGVSVPFSTSDGPTTVTDGMAGGWAHTPRGCALAATYIAYQLAARPADPAVYAETLPDAGVDAQRDAGVADGSLPMQQPESVTRWLVAPDAYQIESYADDLCVMRIASRARPGTDTAVPTWQAGRLTVVWQGGDWKLRADNGVRDSEELDSIVGWTPW